uniref:Uncharacterized protein n=1 Tax=Meloidogyne enterolobii TaxID=390850 RepID=A0A6V7X7B5_MELEN|nr:unnamed protein product [Meloidogyne enterolobii]
MLGIKIPTSEIRYQTPNHQINYQPSSSLPQSQQCLLPSDFWCDNPNIALICTGGSTTFCNNYRRNKYFNKRKIDLKLVLRFN